MSLPVLVVGGGGHAKVVLDILRSGNEWLPCAVIDDDPAKWGKELGGVLVEGGMSVARDIALKYGCRHFIVAVGHNATRVSLGTSLEASGLLPLIAIHASAILSPSVTVGSGTVVMAGVCINADTVIGPYSIINTRAAIDHDCVIGEGVHIAPGVSICGGVSIGALSLLGAGSTVIPGCRIGDGVTIGAAAAVVTDLSPRVVAVGVPARIIKSY